MKSVFDTGINSHSTVRLEGCLKHTKRTRMRILNSFLRLYVSKIKLFFLFLNLQNMSSHKTVEVIYAFLSKNVPSRKVAVFVLLG